MAALQSIRNHPIILTSVLGGGLVLMILMFGFDDFGFNQIGMNPNALTVNGEEVPFDDFSNRFDRAKAFRQDFPMDGDARTLDTEIDQKVRESVYMNTITEMAMADSYKELGIDVNNSEVYELAAGQHLSPVLQNIGMQAARSAVENGMVGYDQYQQYAYNVAYQTGATFIQCANENQWDEAAQYYRWLNRSNWDELKYQIKNARKGEKYAAILRSAIQPNSLEAEDLYNGDNTEYAFKYVMKTAYSVADSLVKVSADEIKAYYNANKELMAYKPGLQLRDIKYIAVPVDPSEADVQKAFDNLGQIEEQFKNGENVPELIAANSYVPYNNVYLLANNFAGELKAFVEGAEVNDVLEPRIYKGDIKRLVAIPNFFGQDGKTDESMSQYCYMARLSEKISAPDSIQFVVTPTTPETLDSLLTVVKAGDMDESATWITDLGVFAQGVSEELRNFIWNAPVGAVQTYDNFGTELIIKVTNRTANVDKYKVALYAERINASSKTHHDLYAQLNSFINKNATIADIEANALDNGFHVSKTTVSNEAYAIDNVKDCREYVREIFDKDNKTGKILEIKELTNYILVACIDSDIKEGYLSLDDEQVKAQIAQKLLPAKKVEYLMNSFANVADKTLEGYAAAVDATVQETSHVSFNTEYISGMGVDPVVNAVAANTPEGTVTAPIAGKNGVYVLQATGKTAKELEYDADSYKAKAANSRAYMYAPQYASYKLVQGAKIEDFRLERF